MFVKWFNEKIMYKIMRIIVNILAILDNFLYIFRFFEQRIIKMNTGAVQTVSSIMPNI